MGDLMYYDGATRRCLCVSCGKKQASLSASKLTAIEPASAAQQLIDRINQLKALPRADDAKLCNELTELKRQLKAHAKDDPAVRRELLRTPSRGTLLAIHARFAGKCCQCGVIQNAGEPVAYDVEQRKIYCYECVPD